MKLQEYREHLQRRDPPLDDLDEQMAIVADFVMLLTGGRDDGVLEPLRRPVGAAIHG